MKKSDITERGSILKKPQYFGEKRLKDGVALAFVCANTYEGTSFGQAL